MKDLQGISIEQAAWEAKVEELRRFQEELEVSRNKYALLYDFAPVGYFTIDRAGFIGSTNLTGERLLGVASSRLIGECFEGFVADEDRFLFRNFISKVFVSQVKETCRVAIAAGNDQPLYVRVEAKVSESGQDCLAVLVDITEKKSSEQALAQSEYNLAKAQAMTQVGSWSMDPSTGEVAASDELLRIMRLSKDEATQEDFARVVHPDDFETVMAHLRKGIEHGKSYEIEHRLQFADGTSKWVYSIIEPSVNSAGKVLKIYGTTQDITARKQIEVELRNKTNELEAIFYSIGDGITVYDHDGRVQHHNLISPRLFPGKIEAGKSCQDIFHADGDGQDCPVERALRGERVDASLVLPQEGQKVRYLDITATPIKDAMEGKNRALVFFRDVSAKRMQELHLIQTEKMSSLGVLATGIAHEINNPLTSIAGFAEALQRRFRDQSDLQADNRLNDFPHYLEVIVRESYRCKAIIDHLLSFGRKSDGFPVKIDLNRVLQEIIELLRYQSSDQKVRVITNLQVDLPRFFGDPSGLRQVCMNLLVNAHHAIKGPGVIEVKTRKVGDATIVMVIRDTGCGIAANLLDRIWEPFFTTKEVGKGVGLGLALTYDIVKRHGGEIHVESSIDEGSKFTVQLPVHLDHGSEAAFKTPGAKR